MNVKITIRKQTNKKIIYSRCVDNIRSIVLSFISKKLCHEPRRWRHSEFIRTAFRFAQIFFRYEIVSFCSLSVRQTKQDINVSELHKHWVMQKSVPIDTPQIFTEYYCILFIIVFNNDLDVNYKFYDFLMAKF